MALRRQQGTRISGNLILSCVASLGDSSHFQLAGLFVSTTESKTLRPANSFCHHGRLCAAHSCAFTHVCVCVCGVPQEGTVARASLLLAAG